MNSDFQMDRIRLLKSETKPYVDELENLIKDPHKLKVVEHPSCDNHLCDASLYGWRHARNFRAEPEEIVLPIEDEIAEQLQAKLDDDLNPQEYDYYDDF